MKCEIVQYKSLQPTIRFPPSASLVLHACLHFPKSPYESRPRRSASPSRTRYVFLTFLGLGRGRSLQEAKFGIFPFLSKKITPSSSPGLVQLAHGIWHRTMTKNSASGMKYTTNRPLVLSRSTMHDNKTSDHYPIVHLPFPGANDLGC